MAQLPKPLVNQALGALYANGDTKNYESHRQLTDYVNQVVKSLDPGAPITPANFAMSGMGAVPTITGTSGTFTRGRFTLTVGTGPSANGNVTMVFPKGLFVTTPFAIIARNGGSGTIGFTYSESTAALILTLVGTPGAGQTFIWQFAVRS